LVLHTSTIVHIGSVHVDISNRTLRAQVLDSRTQNCCVVGLKLVCIFVASAGSAPVIVW
jgi:hypothetical protein